MKICEILSVGTELLLGDVTDTNATFLSRKMREMGYCVYNRQTVGDNKERMENTMRLALERSDLVIVTGGLGPTYDDITKSVAAKLFEMPLVHHEEIADQIRSYFQRRGMKMSDNNLQQALIPEGAEILHNQWGTAPGICLKKNGKTMILLPGVPREMKALFENVVRPIIAIDSGVMTTEILHFYGIGESLLEDRLGDLMKEAKNPTVAPYAGEGEVEVHVTAFGKDLSEAKALCKKTVDRILSVVGEFCYGIGKTSAEAELVRRYAEMHMTLSTAESCTGGLVSQRITSVPGSSEVFSLGVAAYSEKIKERVLGVRSEILKTDGVYSSACALDMARGVRALSGSDVGIGITGIAGPSGGTEKDPVGTVYIAAVNGETELCERCVFGRGNGDREHIRRLASTKALIMALNFSQNNGK